MIASAVRGLLRLLGRKDTPPDQLPPPRTQVLPMNGTKHWEPEFKSFGENPALCPDCGSKDWLFGPEGGLAQNVECSGCGARFNVCVMPGAVMVQRLRDPVRFVELEGQEQPT